MTSRTTPFGIVVVALVSLVAVGCSAPTTAVFNALFDPAGPVASPPEIEVDSGEVVSDSDEAWWPHPDGYAMVLPAGWTGVVVESGDTESITAAVSIVMPGLAGRIADVLSSTGTEISAIAGDPSVASDVAPVMVILAQATDGRRSHVIKTETRDSIRALPGLSGALSAHDVDLPNAKGVRFDYTLMDPDAGEVRVVSYLFRFGRTAYLVNFAAPAAMADESESVFDEIANSLIFGV